MPSESLNLPKEMDSNIIKEVLKQIGGDDELITSVPDNTKLNIEKLAEIENKLTNDQKLKLNNMLSEEDLTAVSGGKINISPKTKEVLKKVGKGAFYLGGSALMVLGTVFLGKSAKRAWTHRNRQGKATFNTEITKLDDIDIEGGLDDDIENEEGDFGGFGDMF